MRGVENLMGRKDSSGISLLLLHNMINYGEEKRVVRRKESTPKRELLFSPKINGTSRFLNERLEIKTTDRKDC